MYPTLKTKVPACVALLVILLAATPTAWSMGKNGGGLLNVHFDQDINYIPGSFPPSIYFNQFADACSDIPLDECEQSYLYECHYGADLDPELAPPPSDDHAELLWVCAVFPDTTCVEIGGVRFGFGDFTGDIEIVDFGHIANLVEFTGGWPGPNEGVELGFYPPLTAHVVPLYFIAGRSLTSALTPLAPFPGETEIIFYDGDGNPIGDASGGDFAIGSWYVTGGGHNPEVGPAPFQHACCDPYTGACEVLTQEDCEAAGLEWQPDEFLCDPNPCPVPPTGVCCSGPEDETCNVIIELACGDLGGTWHGDWDSCDPNPCIALAVCCEPDETCSIVSDDDCIALGGEWFEGLDSCNPNPCIILAACCDEATGNCTVLSAGDCDAAGGIWHESWESCNPNPCPQPPEAACCDPTTGNCSVTIEVDCTGDDEWFAEEATCDPNPCPQPPMGACCYGEHAATCQVLKEYLCTNLGGAWHPDWDTCSPNPCGPEAVCCFDNGACGLRTVGECTSAGGAWLQYQDECSFNPCRLRVCCTTSGQCQIKREDECISIGGTWMEDVGDCGESPCDLKTCCVGLNCYLVATQECIDLDGDRLEDDETCDPNPCDFGSPTDGNTWGKIKSLYRKK